MKKLNIYSFVLMALMMLSSAGLAAQNDLTVPLSRPGDRGSLEIHSVYAEDVVSIWYLSTLDDFRKRGFASTLLNHILVDAAIKYNCDASLIYASPMGFSLFGKFGYRLYAMRQWFLPQELG